MKRCTYCGCENEDEDIYCVACNMKLESGSPSDTTNDDMLNDNIQQQSQSYKENIRNTKTCPICGFENNHDDGYCNNCNSPLNGYQDNYQEMRNEPIQSEQNMYNDNQNNYNNEYDFNPEKHEQQNNQEYIPPNQQYNQQQPNQQYNQQYNQQQANQQYDPNQPNQQVNNYPEQTNKKNKYIGFILNIIVPGLGYAYISQIRRTIVFVVVAVLSLILMGIFIDSYMSVIALMLFVFCYIYPIIDVNNRISHINNRTLQDKHNWLAYVLCLIPGAGFGYLEDMRSFVVFYVLSCILFMIDGLLAYSTSLAVAVVVLIIFVIWLIAWLVYPIYAVNCKLNNREAPLDRYMNR